jgi:hypothetical protein
MSTMPPKAEVPRKRNRKDPICSQPVSYRACNLVERFFNMIKQCRRVATRYGKLAANHLAFIKLASIRIWLRANESHALVQHVTTFRSAQATQPRWTARIRGTAGMLNQRRDAADQPRNAEPEDDGDQHANVKIEIDVARQGSCESSSPRSHAHNRTSAAPLTRHGLIRSMA